MTENEDNPAITEPRPIAVTNSAFAYGNIEAWINIIGSYRREHPEHRVSILYHGEAVNNLISLFKLQAGPGEDDFHLVVAAPDRNLKDVPKLYRLLVEGASSHFGQFIQKEAFKVLDLF